MITIRLSLLTLFVCISVIAFGQDNSSVKQTVINNGIGLGGAIAVAISWSRNKSVLWAIVHGILSWFYVIYYILNRGNEEQRS